MSRDLREIQYVCILNTKLHKMASEDLFSRCQRWSPRGRPWPRGRPRLEGQVLGLGFGLEASSPRKLACPRLEDSSIFWTVKILWSAWKIFWKTFSCGDRLKNFREDLFFFLEIAWKIFVKTFFFLFGEHKRLCPWSLALASNIPVLGLESVCPRKGCPWPWPRIFFVSLALASSLVSSTPPLLDVNIFEKLYEVIDLNALYLH